MKAGQWTFSPPGRSQTTAKPQVPAPVTLSRRDFPCEPLREDYIEKFEHPID